MSQAAIKTETVHNPDQIQKQLKNLRDDFPILSRKINGRELVYLDNAASTQLPKQVIETVSAYHEFHHSNVHRGVHTLSQEATDLYEEAREQIRSFINAPSLKEVIITSGTTDAINLVSRCYGEPRFGKGDVILVSNMEHHANIVPWHMLAEKTGAEMKVIPITDEGSIDMDAYRALLGPDVKMVAVNHISNALGTINPVKEITDLAHKAGAVVMIDGAQAVGHELVDVQALNCDFYAFSGHKMHGPTGIGILYGKEELLKEMKPNRGGGDMILSVSFGEITYAGLPAKFEAGTPPIAQAIGLGAAAKYLSGLDRDLMYQHEQNLLKYATDKLSSVPGLRIIGTSPEKTSIVSFVLDGVHPHDIGTILDENGVAVRTGHHCAQPVMERYNVPATTRASMAFYNTFSEIDALYDSLLKVNELFDVNQPN